MVKAKDISQDILDVLESSSLGMSITKLAKELNCSRTTVTKYIKKLEKQDLVFFQGVGQYRLWHHKEQFESNKDKRESLINFYEPLYNSIIKNLPAIGISETQSKELGKRISRDLDFSDIAEDIIETLIPKKNCTEAEAFNNIVKSTAQILESLCRTFDDFTWEPPIVLTINKIFVLRLKQSQFVKFPIHFYILTGIIEEEMNKYVKVEINVNQIIQNDKIVDLKFELIE
jgi:Mn-dependent DtxR family transcriptional regulator